MKVKDSFEQINVKSLESQLLDLFDVLQYAYQNGDDKEIEMIFGFKFVIDLLIRLIEDYNRNEHFDVLKEVRDVINYQLNEEDD